MSRTLVIPPVNVPGGEAGLGRMEVLLELVDAAGDPIPSSDPGNTLAIHGLGSHIVTDTAVELDLATQNELADETYYRVTVRHGRHEFRRDVQVPADPADITWAQFLGLTNPVTGGLAWAARLLPGDATDGQFAIYDEDTGLWQAVSVAPGAGVEEAPIDGTPYARQDAGWVAAFAGGDGDVVDGGTLATGLTFPADGLHIFDTNASHDLILSPGSNLTADRTLTITTGDANRVLTLTADASVGGTNTGDVTVADSTTVDLSLTGQQVSGAVISQMSITSDASGIKLDGDSATPGNTKLYGTNVSGTKGWYDQPAGGAGHDAVTLAGTLDYLTITGQEITRGAIDLATDVTGALPVLNGGTGGTSLPKLDDLSAPDDNTDLNASTSAHGLLLKATAPASGLMSVVGIANGETVYANKSLFDATNPAALGTAAPGSAMAAARRDHVHTLPKIDDLAAADDNTDLDATVSAHGLLPKLGGGTTNFLRADGTWAAAGGGAPGGADTQVQFNDSSAFGGDAGLTFNKTTKALTVGGATVTTSVPVLNLSQTWNAGAVAFTGLKFNVTDTASSATSLLADFQVGGTSSKLKLRKDGKLTFSTNAALLPSGTGVIFYDNSDSDTFYIQAYNTGVSITSLGSYRFSSSTSPTGTADLMLYRGAANTLHQRNSTNAQTYWLEETYTDTSNYSRLSINAQSGGAFQIKALAAGSGTKRGIQIGAAAADTIAFLGATPAAQRTHVADPSGGSTVDAEARTAINAILVTLETFGFHATS